jgi:thiol-disulfide isomerase/thioredoxin
MRLLHLATVLALSASPLAWSGPAEPYSAARFDQLTHAGKPVLVAIHADWCPTCKAQKPILGQLMGRPEYKDVTELTVDYDKDKTAVRRFKANMQSTLVAYKGDKEVGRSVGDTTPAGIEQLVKKAAH